MVFLPESEILFLANWMPAFAQALMSIGAVKAVEIGDGVKVSTMKGSEDNDGFHMENGRIVKTTNHSGGILGGISDGGEILLRAHIKPTPSIAQPQQTVTTTGENISIEIKGRHDPGNRAPRRCSGRIHGCHHPGRCHVLQHECAHGLCEGFLSVRNIFSLSSLPDSEGVFFYKLLEF